MCNGALIICNVTVAMPFSNSDHNRVEFSMCNDSDGSSNSVKFRPYASIKAGHRDWSKANFEGMAKHIAAIDGMDHWK